MALDVADDPGERAHDAQPPKAMAVGRQGQLPVVLETLGGEFALTREWKQQKGARIRGLVEVLLGDVERDDAAFAGQQRRAVEGAARVTDWPPSKRSPVQKSNQAAPAGR